MVSNLYTDMDYSNLGNKVLDELKPYIPGYDKSKDEEYNHEYILDNIKSLLLEEDIKKIIDDNIFCTKGSIKWYKILNKDLVKKEIVDEIEKHPMYNYKLYKETNLENKKNSIVGICKENDLYTIKILLLDGYIYTNNGISESKIEKFKNIILKINPNDGWIEIRANEVNCKKVLDIIKRELKIKDTDTIKILNKYQNDTTKFKDDLIDGFYINSDSMPAQDIILTQDDADSINKVFEAVDNYFINYDLNELEKELKKSNFQSDGLSIKEIMLAGLDTFKIKVRSDSAEDMSKQSMHSIFRDHLVEESSYIKFSNIKGGTQYTIQLGLKTNTIVFKSNVKESVIEYIRNKIV